MLEKHTKKCALRYGNIHLWFHECFMNILLMLIMLIPDGGTMMVVQCSVLPVLVLNGLVR